MPRFRVLATEHHEGGEVYKKGDEFDSPHNLDKMFVNKFERIGGTNMKNDDHDDFPDHAGKVMDDAPHKPKRTKAAAPAPEEQVSNDEGDEDESKMKAEKPEETEATENPFGIDVTDKFPKARSADLKVFKNDDGFTIVDSDRPDVKINTDDLETKKSVNEFLSSRGKA